MHRKPYFASWRLCVFARAVRRSRIQRLTPCYPRSPALEGITMFSLFSKTILSPLLLRGALAAIFIFHGLNLVGGPDNDWGTHWAPESMSQPPPVQAAVAWGELLGGVALAFGFLTRLAA